MADVRLAHHRNKQAPRPGQGGTSRNPPPHETPPADRQDRSAASSDRRHRKTLADLAWNRLRFVQNDGIRNEPNWRVVRSVHLVSLALIGREPLHDGYKFRPHWDALNANRFHRCKGPLLHCNLGSGSVRNDHSILDKNHPGSHHKEPPLGWKKAPSLIIT